MTTAIQEIPFKEDVMTVVKVYNLQGQLVKSERTTIEKALKGLAQGVYVVNGHKMYIGR